MRNTLLAFACGSVLFIGGAALAADTQSGQAGLQNINATNSDPMLCKYIYHDGGLIRSSRCHTASEWANIRMHNQRDISTMQTRALMVHN